MAKNDDKKKSGLHKDISSIFDGVPVPSDRTPSRPGPQQGQAGYDSPRPPAQAPQNPQIPGAYQRPARPGVPEAVQKTALQQAAKKLGVNTARQKMMLLLIPILIVVFVIMLGRVVDIPFLTTKKPVPPKVPTVTPPVAVSSKINWQKPDPYPPNLRDPMQLTRGMIAQLKAREDAAAQALANAAAQKLANQTVPEKTVGELTVKGILFSTDNPSAVIGTRIAHIGDVIAGATVVKINPNSVEFERDGETWTQTVEP